MKKDWKKILQVMIPIILSAVDLITKGWKMLNEEFSEEVQNEYKEIKKEVKECLQK